MKQTTKLSDSFSIDTGRFIETINSIERFS